MELWCDLLLNSTPIGLISIEEIVENLPKFRGNPSDCLDEFAEYFANWIVYENCTFGLNVGFSMREESLTLKSTISENEKKSGLDFFKKVFKKMKFSDFNFRRRWFWFSMIQISKFYRLKSLSIYHSLFMRRDFCKILWLKKIIEWISYKKIVLLGRQNYCYERKNLLLGKVFKYELKDKFFKTDFQMNLLNFYENSFQFFY